MTTQESAGVDFLQKGKVEKHKTETDKDYLVNKLGGSYCFSFEHDQATGKRWSIEFPLITEK